MTHSKIKSLGTHLKTARIKAGLTQGQVAKILGHTSPQYPSNYERGIVNPSIETVLKLISPLRMNKKQTYALMVGIYRKELWQQFKAF